MRDWRWGRYEHQTGTSDALMNHVDISATSLGLAGITVPHWMEGTDYSHIRVKGSNASALEAAKAAEPDSALLQLVTPTKHGDSFDRPWRGVDCRDGWRVACHGCSFESERR
jgi:arylsulfatase A-like enzyme